MLRYRRRLRALLAERDDAEKFVSPDDPWLSKSGGSRLIRRLVRERASSDAAWLGGYWGSKRRRRATARRAAYESAARAAWRERRTCERATAERFQGCVPNPNAPPQNGSRSANGQNGAGRRPGERHARERLSTNGARSG